MKDNLPIDNLPITQRIDTLFDTVNAHGHRIGRLLIKAVVLETTMGGFALSEVDQHKEKPESSEVIMASSGVTGIAVGDIILHNRFAGVKFTHDGVNYMVITTDDAYAKFKAKV